MVGLKKPHGAHIMNTSMEFASLSEWPMAHFGHCPYHTPIEALGDEGGNIFDENAIQELPREDLAVDDQLTIAGQTATPFDRTDFLDQTSSEQVANIQDAVDEVAPVQIQLCVCQFDVSPGTNAASGELVTYVRECLRKASDCTEFLKQLEDTHLSDYQDFLTQVIAASVGVIVALTRRWMRKVAEATGVLPRSLFIEQLQVDGMHPVATGGFSDIFKGVVNDKPVALKVLRHISQERTFRKEFCMEALVWHQLNHPHILPLLGVSQTAFEKRVCLVSPWMQHGHILQYLASRPKLIPTKLLHQASLGLNYLHTLEPPLVHGDIKAVNLLINEKEEVYIADFGLISLSETYIQAFATARDTRASDGGGTVRWMAPELLAGTDTKSREGDIYAFGMMMLEVFTGRAPYCHIISDGQVIFAVSRGELPQRPEASAARSLNDEIWMVMTESWRAKGKRPDSRQLSHKLECLILPEQPGEREVCRREEDSSAESPNPKKRGPLPIAFFNSRLAKRPRLVVSGRSDHLSVSDTDSPQRPLGDGSEIKTLAGMQTRTPITLSHQQRSNPQHKPLVHAEPQTMQSHLAGMDHEQRRMWSMQQEIANQGNLLGQQAQRNAILDPHRSNPQFQQLSPQQQAQAISQATGVQMSRMAHPQQQSLSPHTNPMQQHVPQQWQIPHQQLEQPIRNPSTNQNLFQMGAKRRAFSAAGDTSNVNPQLQVSDDRFTTRAPTGIQNRGSLVPTQQQQPGQSQQQLAQPQPFLVDSQPTGTPAHRAPNIPQMPQSYAQCLERINQQQAMIQRDEAEISMATQTRPELDKLGIISQIHQNLHAKRQVLMSLHHMLNNAPFSDRPPQNMVPTQSPVTRARKPSLSSVSHPENGLYSDIFRNPQQLPTQQLPPHPVHQSPRVRQQPNPQQVQTKLGHPQTPVNQSEPYPTQEFSFMPQQPFRSAAPLAPPTAPPHQQLQAQQPSSLPSSQLSLQQQYIEQSSSAQPKAQQHDRKRQVRGKRKSKRDQHPEPVHAGALAEQSPSVASSVLTRPPTDEDYKRADGTVRALRLAVERNIPEPSATVSDAELPEWYQMFELATKAVPDVDKHLITHFMLFRDHVWLRRLVGYVAVISRQQRRLLQPGPPSFMANIETLRMIVQLFQQSMVKVREQLARFQPGVQPQNLQPFYPSGG